MARQRQADNDPHTDGDAVMLHRLWRRYIAALALVVVLLTSSWACKATGIEQASRYAAAINTAGRQRMLSQRIRHYATKFVAQPNAAALHTDLEALVTNFDAQHQKLRTLAWASPDVQAVYAPRDGSDGLDAAMRTFLASCEGILTGIGAPTCLARIDDLADTDLLDQLDLVVATLERDADAASAWLYWFETVSLLAALGTIAIEVGLVFWPGQRLIRANLARLTARNEQLKLLGEQLADRNTELASALDDSEALRREQGEFTYALSHDMKSPANTVNMLLAELSEQHGTELSDDARDLLQLARGTVDRMRELVESVLNYSRTVSGERSREAVDLDAALDAVCADLRAAIEGSGTTIERGPLGTVHGNAMQLRMLLQNLLDNAMKFRAADRPPVIRVAAQHDENSCVLRVADNGIGIPAAARKRVFGLFGRLHTRDEYPGSGIGLALCQRIARNHGGRIEIDGEADSGTTFAVTLTDDEESYR